MILKTYLESGLMYDSCLDVWTQIILPVVTIGGSNHHHYYVICAVDHSLFQPFDKRVLYVTNAVFSIYLRWL